MTMETTVLKKQFDIRKEAQAAQKFVLRVGFDAKMLGCMVLAYVPEFELNVLAVLEEMGWKVVQ